MDVDVLLYVLIWLVIAGVALWLVQYFAAALRLPRVIVVLAQAVIVIAFLVWLLKLVGAVDL